ncbi:TerC family protein [Nonomuraea sp. 10N515B]|uniref:TerC family protein n=1 Tax=Nonomuraea sp. 10N515B TaxID=3457422 RepID=UPI003FCCF646
MAEEDGTKVITPLFLVFIAIGTTDLLFALDSIPAIFGITQHPLIVFAANAFALLGLRALYFLIEGLLERLVYLSLGLPLILAFIGVKLILAFLHQDVTRSIPEIPSPISLAVIMTTLLVTVAASMWRVRRHPEERAHAGALRHFRQEASNRRNTPEADER